MTALKDIEERAKAMEDMPSKDAWYAYGEDVPALCAWLREALELLAEDTLRMSPEAFDAPQPAGMSRKELTAWQRERNRETRIRALLVAVGGKP